MTQSLYEGVPWRDIAKFNPRIGVVGLEQQQQKTLASDIDQAGATDVSSGISTVPLDLLAGGNIAKELAEAFAKPEPERTFMSLEEYTTLFWAAKRASLDSVLDHEDPPVPTSEVLAELADAFQMINRMDKVLRLAGAFAIMSDALDDTSVRVDLNRLTEL